MAISFDNAASQTTGTSSTPITTTLTIAASANEIVIGTCRGDSNDNSGITSVTIGGVSATKRADIVGVAGDYGAMSLWELLNPPTGSNVVINVNFNVGNMRGFTAASYIGALGGFGVSNTGSVGNGNSGITATSAAIAANSWTVACFATGSNPPLTIGTGSTLRGSQFSAFGLCDSNGAVSSTSMAVTFSSTSPGDGAFAVVSLAPTAATTALPLRALLGVGK